MYKIGIIDLLTKYSGFK